MDAAENTELLGPTSSPVKQTRGVLQHALIRLAILAVPPPRLQRVTIRLSIQYNLLRCLQGPESPVISSHGSRLLAKPLEMGLLALKPSQYDYSH